MTRRARRHALSTRIWHWLNFACIVVLFMSGLNISNAHPRLYWGQWGFEAKDAWLFLPDFPGWMTIPSYYSLGRARDWHVLTVWVFAVGLLLYMIIALANRHFSRDIATSRKEWRSSSIREDVARHLRLDFESEDGKYNFLQKASYSLVLFVLLPVMIVSGMAISPGMDAAWPFLTDIFGGRQSARSIHFICAWAIVAFLVVHVALVLLSNPVRQLRDMITGGGER